MLTMAKPCFNAICVHASRLALTVSRTEGGAAQRSQSDSTIIFVASRRQTMLTAIDLITFAKSAGDEFMFVGKGDAASNAIETAIAALEASAVAGVASASSASVSVIGGAASKAAPGAAALRAKQAVDVLATALRSGVGYWHSGLSAYAKKLVASLYERGAIGVIVATQASCWGIPFTAKLVVLMGGQRYDSRESKYVDCAIADILQMVGCACRPHLDASGKGGVCVILCQNARKQYFKKFLYEPLPVESHLDHRLADHLNAEIVVKTVENKQDAVDYLTWSFYYRRINQNPGYYNLIGTTPQHMSDHLSELIEETLTDLSEARCVEVEEDVDVRPLNLGMIASYYYAQYTSIELFASSINAKTKMKGLITILCAASEFETTEVRPGDEARLLKRLGKYIPHRVDNKQPPTIKSNVLLQSHFSRASLPAQLRTDQRRIVTQTPSLLSAMVDVIASSNYLAPVRCLCVVWCA
jgi:pre-mRNA-splicing helicase BRR2